MLYEVNQEESEHDEVDVIKNRWGDACRKSRGWFIMRKMWMRSVLKQIRHCFVCF